jgi:uncharacterized protein DUF5335
MSDTTRIPEEKLNRYFSDFTRRFLRDDSPEAVDVEVVAPDLGDQWAARGARLRGITYDDHEHALEFELDSGDHRVFHPKEVWAVEEPDGFVSAIQVVHPDGRRDIARVKRAPRD